MNDSSIVVMNTFLVGQMVIFMKGEEDYLAVGDMAAVRITATKIVFVVSKYQRNPE